MFERYLTDLVTTHFGHFIANMDPGQMRVSAWRGAVVLEDVELRKDCLDHFFPINTAATDANGGCPLEICHGRVGRLELRIPWKLLRSQLFVSSSSSSAASSSSTTSNSSSATKSKNAVDATTTTTTSAAAPVDPSLAICVVINNVNILVTPRKTKKKHPSEPCDIPNNNNNNNTDDHNHNTSKRLEDLSVAEQDAIRESSAQQAMDAELLGRIARSARPLHQQSPPIDEEEEVGATTKNNDATLAVTWKTKLQERAKALLSNLSVTIQNIHIRYEDPGTSMGFRWQTCSNNSPEDSSGFGLDDSFVTCTTSQQYILQRQSLADQIRYRPSFAIGVTLSEFTIQNAPPAAEVPVSFTSTNVPSSPTLTPVHDTKERSALQYKIASAQQLAIYWDSNAHIMSANNVRGGNNEETVDGFSTLQTFNFEAEFELINRVNEPTISIPTSEYSIRMFLLEPSSPSIRLGLSSSEKTSPPCTNTVDVSLLPCRFFVSRNLMEDLSYLRTCFAIWKQSQNGLLLSEETLQHLAHLRPKQESSSPRGWWKYAFAAVSAVVKSHCNHQPNAPPSSKEIPLRRYKGWVGLSQALGRRRFYSSLYRTFLVCDDQYGREMAHDDLLLYERTLLVDEIVSFRIETVKDIRDDVKNGRPAPSTKTWETLLLTMSSARNENDVDDSDVVSALNVPLPQDVLSAEHRSQMFVEIAMALNREQRNLDLQISILGNRCIPPRDTIAMVTMKVTKLATWKALFQCSELSFQVNDSVELPRDGIRELGSIRGTALTVVKLSCAVKYEQELFDDGSWDMTSRVGSLLVEDSTVHNCKTLIGLKRGFQSDPTDEDTFLLCGSTYHQNIWVRIQRTMWKTADCPGSTTSTMVRVLPLEVIYTTAPFELLNHVFNVANLDFADDYNHIANRLATWRRRQQNRLISALAHKQKKILVDVIVGAPVLVFQDDRDPDLRFLSIDLGKLEFANNNNGFEGCDMDVDDKWRLQLTDVQIQSTARQNVNSIEDVSSQWAEKIIEPFSLTIELAAKFLSESNMVSEEETVVRCSISLPRLALNLTSSIFHLGRRLKTKWEVQSNRRRPVSLFPRQSATTTSSHAGGLSSAKKLRTDSARRLELHFSAPFFGLTFENDQVGHLDGSLSSPSTKPLIELALQGIEGRLIQERQPEGTSTDFTAKIRALGVVDLYQTAGDKFAFLISSVSPDLLNRGTTVSMKSFDSHLSVTDLVLFEYSAWGSSSEPSNSRFEQSGNRGDKLYIKFNELYIEWNPETLSAVCAVLYLSDDDYVDFSDGLVGSEKPIPRSGRCQGQGAGDHEDEFYDAVEEAFFDAESDVYMGNRSPLLSEVSESDQSAAAEIESVDLSPKFSWTTQQSSPPRAFLPSAVLGSPWTMQVRRPITAPPLPSTPLRVRPFEIVFMLSKLRVNFNRESRHRRLLTAEMDGTVVRRANLKEGGWRTLFTIGNLTFADCESSNNRTLYREILGLKTDAGPTATIFSSLLEMELITKPRSRCYVSLATDLDDPSLASDLPVSVDNEAGAVHGFDNYLRARFSPMRFVYLQQLWFEIIDYFFIGIVGYEVWGGKTPPPGDLSILEGHSICADEISFTRFDVRMDVPLLLFPVSSCSTDFVRVEADSISFSNQYSYAPLRSPSLQFRDGGNRQWYNKCKVEICSVSLSSWAGNTMNKANNRPSVSLSLAWPVGPSAPVNVPKWKAECVVGDLHLQLNRQHYALLQHIIQFNICEESHHLEEWYALQSLTQENRQSFLNGIRVHFGYDKKDATPSTFVVDLVVPTITFTIQCDDGQDIAVVRCSDVRWNYEKLADRVSKQLVNCDFEIISSMLDSVILTTNKTRTVSLPRLSYSTTTKPSGDNTKSLCVDDSCIFFVFPAWVLISSFFQNLPQPKYLSPSEAIQVGDRWYRIGEQNVLNREKDDVLLKWLVYDSLNQPETFVSKSQVKYEFRLSLKRPTIDFGGSESAIVLSADHIQFLHIGQADLLQRSFQISDMEVQTRRAGQGAMSSDCSLIRPWTVSVSMESCNGRQTCSCESHVYRLFADTLYARASFSDIAIVLDTALSQFRDAKNAEKPIHEKPKPQSSNEKFDSSDSMCQSTTTQNLNFEWKGFRLVVADNSGRQFAGDQELFIAHLGPVDLFRESRYFSNNDALDHMTPASASVEYSTRLKLSGLDFFDCLQAINSPFRHVIAVHPTPRYHQNAESFPVQPDGKEGGLKPAIVLWNTVAATNAYGVEVSSMEIQYNPSFVVAIQRFLGRLFKEVRQLHPDLGFVKTNRPLNTNVAKSDTKISSIAVLRADIDVRHISIRLNKEHQKRRLLEASIASVHVGCEWTALGCLIRGHIGSVHAVNPEAKRDGYIEDVLKNACDVEKVVNFRYRSFTKRKIEHQHSTEAVPDWISQELGSSDVIDDFLEVNIATLEAVYLRERTAELIDYLTNGMPGKGMGVTSRAAQEFVTDRIQKKSFFNVKVDAPRLLIPQNPVALSGLSVRLGDLQVRSWISDGREDTRSVATRMLTVVLLGFSVGVYRNPSISWEESFIASDVDVSVDLRMSSAEVVVACRLSDLFVRLSYTEYSLICLILQENIGEKMKKERWDNVETEWENEVAENVNELSARSIFSNDVIYSSSARLVRYGRRNVSSTLRTLTVSLTLGTVSLVLQRDDGDLAVPYDMLLLEGQDFDFEIGRKEDGDEWLNLSLRRLFVFDLGKLGRHAHMSSSNEVDEADWSSRSVLVTGYSPAERTSGGSNGSEFESQIVIKIDKLHAPSNEIKVVFVVSFLSVAAFVGPTRDLVQFLSCKWPILSADYPPTRMVSEKTPTIESKISVAAPRQWNLRFVLHYPRLLFAADESDPHSRALVVRGLSIANGFYRPSGLEVGESLVVKSGGECFSSVTCNADFQRISSHICPDIAEIVRLSRQHLNILGKHLSTDHVISQSQYNEIRDETKEIGVPLLLPLTVNLELEQTPSQQTVNRSLSVSVDPLSVMLSNDDIRLVQEIANEWKATMTPSTEVDPFHQYDYHFKMPRLGLGLRKDEGCIVVDNVADHALKESINVGDILIAINGKVIVDPETVTLAEMVSRLSAELRPLCVTFERRLHDGKEPLKDISYQDGMIVRTEFLYKMDMSLSSAVFTVVEKEVPLFRGSISTTKVDCRIKQSDDAEYFLDVSAALGIEYYNLRIWGWESVVEPCVICLSLSFHQACGGAKELAVELGDRDGGISVNISDALVETYTNLLKWRQPGDELAGEHIFDMSEQEESGNMSKTRRRDFISRRAAQEALRFANKQKSSNGKPFLFRNRTGLSLAFAQQISTSKRDQEESKQSLSTVGDYRGLEQFRTTEILVVANEDETKFFTDMNISFKRTSKQDGARFERFPFLSVALQETNGVSVGCFQDLQISYPDETLLPIKLSNELVTLFQASWLVEYEQEKTVITMGSSVRLVSFISQPVDVKLEACLDVKKNQAIILHTLRTGIPFCLPLSITLQQHSYKCSIRLSPEYDFSPLFIVSPNGSVSFDEFFAGCVECRSTNSDRRSAWLAVASLHDSGILTISVDSSVTIRNMLPTSIDWDLMETEDECRSDGYPVQLKNMESSRTLMSGAKAEILCREWVLSKIRWRFLDCQWSAWTSFSLSKYEKDDEDNIFVSIFVKDTFNIALPLGLRFSRKASGVDVSVYADLWCSNCTSLDLVFGCPQELVTGSDTSFRKEGKKSEELSVAEATLKEISSLFDASESVGSNSQIENSSLSTASGAVRLSGQVAPNITEECFEYLEIDNGCERRRWWASENPFDQRESVFSSADYLSIRQNTAWEIDFTGKTLDGWESSPILSQFSPKREYNPCNRYRRRRWIFLRCGIPKDLLLDGVNAYCHSSALLSPMGQCESRSDQLGVQMALQVSGGRWSLSSFLPRKGTVHGVMRAPKSRWPAAMDQSDHSTNGRMFELCYTITPLDGDWGVLTRCMLVSSRFLLRNDSDLVTFEVKQTGNADATATTVLPGQTVPFHWGDFRLPELVSVRPDGKQNGMSIYRWSGGFDPLTIGHIPIRVRKTVKIREESFLAENVNIHAIKMEVEIRPRTGGTGLTISFREEDPTGSDSLYRIDNLSPFPIWFCQEDVLGNSAEKNADAGQGEILCPYGSIAFALDVPFKRGKYTNRKAASLAVLLRARIALAPLSTRPGIETAKVVSLANAGAGAIVRLNPSKLAFLDGTTRRVLQKVRVLGVVHNDGPTRVLTLRLMEKQDMDSNPWRALGAIQYINSVTSDLSSYTKLTIEGAIKAVEMQRIKSLPSEESAIRLTIESRATAVSPNDNERVHLSNIPSLIVSLRVAFSELMVSLIDGAPSEIAVATLRNMNAIANWDVHRATDSTVYVTISSVQVDNMVPNAPFPVAVCPFDLGGSDVPGNEAPVLVIGLSFAPKHKSKILCLTSATIAPRNLEIKVDLAFLVRMQKFALELQGHFEKEETDSDGSLRLPEIHKKVNNLQTMTTLYTERQKIYFGGLTILPCNIKLSVAPARALTPAQAVLEGSEAAAIHQAVRKGDVLLDQKRVGILGVKVGSRNKTLLAVLRGLLKSFVVDGLMRLDGASLNFSGVSLRNYTSTGSQLTTALGAHYLASLRQNLPAVLGSLAALGNPLGLVRGLGEGVGDFVLEPVRGFQRSVQEMDASYLVDGVAKGTLSLARHTVGGFADSAAMLAETFSKNMAVLTLDRRYAQKRDRGDMLRDYEDVNVASGLGSGVQKLVNGFVEGVTGVVKAPIRGAEKRGLEGFAKGVGKGLLGLLVKPIIGISDGFTDVMIGVKGTVDGASGYSGTMTIVQVRPRRAMYGLERSIRPYHYADAAACALMLRTRLAGESYLSHLDMGDRVALLTVKRIVILGLRGEEKLVLKLKDIASVQVRNNIEEQDSHGSRKWALIVLLNTPQSNGSDVEVISCTDNAMTEQLGAQLEHGRIIAGAE